ncbi:hypothetical protein C7440_1776 [Pusillimonas noertemannii]|uniref:Mor transcription activator family protein n=1 Tax=Pusillimonas noertemannii TaxID=305977 RepID=A0A2U1CMP7_9BURK|nr:hypothetical protein C7440_1776 [Pusillimonas noertemannii]
MAKSLRDSRHVDLLAAFRDGLFSEAELRAVIKPALRFVPDVSSETVIRLIEAYGGLRMYVALSMEDNAWMLDIMPNAEAWAFIEGYGGHRVQVPFCLMLRSTVRARVLAALRAHGWSMHQLVACFRIHNRSIQEAVRRFHSQGGVAVDPAAWQYLNFQREISSQSRDSTSEMDVTLQENIK